MKKEITIDGKLYRLVEEEETDKEDYIESLKPWIPKVGDWVRITKSINDWAYGMDKFVGMVVQIIEIANAFDECRITFYKYDGWSWSYREGHFVKATDEEVKAHLSEKENPKLDYGNGIGYNACELEFLFEFDGHKYYEGDKCYYFGKENFQIYERYLNSIVFTTLEARSENSISSKIYPTREKCEGALREYVCEILNLQPWDVYLFDFKRVLFSCEYTQKEPDNKEQKK